MTCALRSAITLGEVVNEQIKQIALAYADQCAEEELDLLRTLAQIPSPSHREGLRERFCLDWLIEQGAALDQVRIDEAGNVILDLGQGEGGDYAVFSAHTDVVFPDEGLLPLREDEERLYAPGVGDDTANLVGLLIAARFFLRHKVPLRRGILVVADACEEGLGNLDGTKQLFRDFGQRVSEFTSFDLYLGENVTSAVGSHRWRVTCTTEGGHSWENFGRKNAIETLCGFIEGLYAIELPTAAKTTVNVGRFEGGTTVNSIAQEASVLVEYRSASEACLEEMFGKFVALVEEHVSQGSRIDVELLGKRPAGGTGDPAAQDELVRRSDEVLRDVAGVEPRHQESSTDANVPLSLGIPAHTIGTVRGGLLHTREEWVEKASLRKGLAVILALMLEHAAELPEVEDVLATGVAARTAEP